MSMLEPLSFLYPGGGGAGLASALPVVQHAREPGRKIISFANFGGHTTHTMRNEPTGYSTPLDFISVNCRFPNSFNGPGGTRFGIMEDSIATADLAAAKADLIAIASAGTMKAVFIGITTNAPNDYRWDDDTLWNLFEANITEIVNELVLGVNSAVGFEFIPGFVWENEPYGYEIMRYAHTAGPTDTPDTAARSTLGMNNTRNNPNSLTLEQMTAKVKERADSVSTLIHGLKDDIIIIQGVGYVQHRYDKLGATPRYVLLKAWMDGWLDGTSANAVSIELIQDSYGKTTADEYMDNKTDSTYGWETLVFGTDYDTSNFSRHEFCMAVWPDFHTRGVQAASSSTNTVIVPTSGLFVNGDLFWTPQTGTRTVTAVSGTSVTYSGSHETIPAGEVVLGYSPTTVRQAFDWAEAAGNSEFVLLYYQAAQPHRNIPSPPLFNSQIIDGIGLAV